MSEDKNGHSYIGSTFNSVSPLYLAVKQYKMLCYALWSAFVLKLISGRWEFEDILHVESRSTKGPRGIDGGRGGCLRVTYPSCISSVLFSSANSLWEVLLVLMWAIFWLQFAWRIWDFLPTLLWTGDENADLPNGDSQNKAFDKVFSLPASSGPLSVCSLILSSSHLAPVSS